MQWHSLSYGMSITSVDRCWTKSVRVNIYEPIKRLFFTSDNRMLLTLPLLKDVLHKTFSEFLRIDSIVAAIYIFMQVGYSYNWHTISNCFPFLKLIPFSSMFTILTRPIFLFHGPSTLLPDLLVAVQVLVSPDMQGTRQILILLR